MSILKDQLNLNYEVGMKKLFFLLISFSFLFFIPNLNAQNKDEVKSVELKVGMTAPDFVLPDANGHYYKLSSYKGKSPVVVYFYPKAETPGCTKEACGIRDTWNNFKKNKIQVLGISVDPKKDIKKFIKDYRLNFPLLSDAGQKVSKEYGVFNDKGYDNRITFVVDKNGRIADIIHVKNIEQHASQVFTEAKKLL